MKKNTACKFPVFAAALLSALLLFSACAEEKTEAPQESGQVVAGLTSPLPSPAATFPPPVSHNMPWRAPLHTALQTL